jgi:ribokinase
VVDVGDDAEAADSVERGHNLSILADRRAVPDTVLLVTRLVVVGSANVDLVWHGPRLPAPGETTTDGTFETVLGGKGANQAAAARALGADVCFVGCVGSDPHGDAIVADLETRGIDCTNLRRSAEPTGTAFVLVDDTGENMIAVAPGANRALDNDAVDRAIEPGDVVLCSCEIPLCVVEAAAATGLGRGAQVIVNPAPARRLFAGAILTPNEHECAALGGLDAMLSVAPAVVVTHGRDGAALHVPGDAALAVDSFPVDVVDTTGAGDAFNGALAWAISEGRALPDAVRLACAAGALATRGLGARASLPTAADVYALATS